MIRARSLASAVAAAILATMTTVVVVPPPEAAAAAPFGGGEVLVDDLGGQVFMTRGDTVEVYRPDGTRLATIGGQPGATDLLLQGRTLYVMAASADRINAFDADTRVETGGWSVATTPYPRSMAWTAGRIWYSYGSQWSGGLASLAPDTGVVHASLVANLYGQAEVTATQSPDRVYTLDRGLSPSALRRYDIVDGTPKLIGAASASRICGNGRDLALSTDGSKAWLACGSPYHVTEVSTAALTSPVATYPAEAYPLGVARSADGRFFVGALDNDFRADLYVYAPGTPTALATIDVGTAELADAMVAMSDDGTRVYAADRDGVLHTIDLKPAITTRSVQAVAPGQQFVIRGTQLRSATSVRVGTAAATFAVQSDGNLLVTAPPALGTQPITVTNPFGTNAPSEAAEIDVRTGSGVADGIWEYHDTPVSGTYQPVVGQFAGDRASDILWYGAGSLPDSLWIGHQSRRGLGGFTRLPLTVNGRYRPIVGDFAGDDYDDILWYAAGAAADPMWISRPGPDDRTPDFDRARTYRVDATYSHTPVLRDFRPGAKDDIFFYGKGATPDRLLDFRTDGSGQVTTVPRPVNGAYSHVFSGDWNGDLREDVFFYAAGSTPDYRWTSGATTGYTTKTYQVNGTYTPVNLYDDRDNILWWASGRGAESYWRSSATSFEIPRVAPLDEPGVAYSSGRNAAVVVGASGAGLTFLGNEPGYWYELTMGRPGPTAGQLPLVGDFDLDGYVDTLYYGAGARPDSLWYADTAGFRSRSPGATAPAPEAPKATAIGDR